MILIKKKDISPFELRPGHLMSGDRSVDIAMMLILSQCVNMTAMMCQNVPQNDHLGNNQSLHPDLYDISYVWYSCIGSSLVVIVALLSSCMISSQVGR